MRGTATGLLGPRHADPAPQRLSTARSTVLRRVVAAEGPITVTTLARDLGQHPNTIREHLDALAMIHLVERVKSAPEGRGRPAWLYRATPSARVAARSGLGPTALSAGNEYAALALSLIDQVASTSARPEFIAEQAGERWGRSLAEQRAVRRYAVVQGEAIAGDGALDVDATGAASASGDVAAGTTGRGPGAGPDEPGGGIAPVPFDGDPTAEVVDMLSDLRFSPEASADPSTTRLTTCPILDAARRNPALVCQVHLGIVRGALGYLGGNPGGAELAEFAEPGACLLTLRDGR